MLHKRQKGGRGEREFYKLLNDRIASIRLLLGKEEIQPPFQRNQNQTAIGGSDLTNPFGLSIEVKRQEALHIASWWEQCTEQAAIESGKAILAYRQNRKPWRIRMQLFDLVGIKAINKMPHIDFNPIVEIDLTGFMDWFDTFYRGTL